MRWFGRGAGREIVAGVTTYLTMAYILFVNPQILGAAGMDQAAVFAATCLASAVATALMGLYADLPVALAPGMGMNAYFAFTVVPALGGDWRLALGCVFLAALAFLAISLSPARAWLIDALPKSLKLAIAAGIGLFLALIGLANAGVVVAAKDTIVGPGTLTSTPVLIAGGALAMTAALSARKIAGAILIGIVAATLAAVALGAAPLPNLATAPPSLAPAFFELHFGGAGLGAMAAASFTFLLVMMLDTSGTLTAVAHQAGLTDEAGRLRNGRRALVADASGAAIGALIGTSPVTAYIESAAGIEAGGRTGLTASTVAALFILSLFLAPLAGAVPAYATAPALVFVAALMMRGLGAIPWDDPTEAVPALLTALAIPLTYSIATGIGIGFIAYTAIKLAAGRWAELNGAVALIAAAFALMLLLG